MKTIKSTDLTERVERLERQNLILKTIGLTGLFIASIFFVINSTAAKDSEIVAQKFTLISPDGKECGYLGYDSATKNPRLSLKQCGGTPEVIGLLIEKDSPSLRLDALGRPMAILSADKNTGSAQLMLESSVVSENSSGVAFLSSGNAAVAPQFFLEGREKGRIDLWQGRDFFRIQDANNLKRFSIDKSNPDTIALHFFDKNGNTETYKVPPTTPTKIK